MISETERVDELGYNSIRISFNAILLFVLFFMSIIHIEAWV